MATQSERRATTRAAILKTARHLFGDRGFENTMRVHELLKQIDDSDKK